MGERGIVETRKLGSRGPVVTRLGLGCAPLGNLFAPVSEHDAAATVEAAWQAGVRFFDTAPLYGHGLSERRLGTALSRYRREEFVVATKVGRLLQPPVGTPPVSIFADAPALEPVFDFSRDGVLRSIEASLQRLGLDRIDVVHVHDPDDHEAEALAGAFPALLELREHGVVQAVGCGMNQTEMLDRVVERVDLDCVLLAGRYTLLDRRGADSLLPRCQERNVGVIIGGVFNSGLLADPDANPTFDYAPAPSALADRARRMRASCERHGTRLPAAALQFALRHPAVTSVVVGARSAAEIRDDVDDAHTPLAPDLWAELEQPAWPAP